MVRGWHFFPVLDPLEGLKRSPRPPLLVFDTCQMGSESRIWGTEQALVEGLRGRGPKLFKGNRLRGREGLGTIPLPTSGSVSNQEQGLACPASNLAVWQWRIGEFR